MRRNSFMKDGSTLASFPIQTQRLLWTWNLRLKSRHWGRRKMMMEGICSQREARFWRRFQDGLKMERRTCWRRIHVFWDQTFRQTKSRRTSLLLRYGLKSSQSIKRTGRRQLMKEGERLSCLWRRDLLRIWRRTRLIFRNGIWYERRGMKCSPTSII